MQQFLSLNAAAVSNLLDGQFPRFAIMAQEPSGLRITPRKNRRGDVVEVDEGFFPLPEYSASLKGKPLGVRLDDDGSLIVYEVATARGKNFPAAQVIARSETKAAEEPVIEKRPRGRPPKVAEPVATVAEIIDDRQRFIIRREEVMAPRKPAPPPEPVRENLEQMSERVSRQWAQRSFASHEPETLHFSEAPVPFGSRRLSEKTITVPVSFDRRKNAGQRQVEVMVKRRRSLH